MKTTTALTILLLAGPGLLAQSLQFHSDLFLFQPTGVMSKTMNNAFGLTLGASKSFQSPFSAGLEMSLGNYGHQTSRQQYTFDDGAVTETDVNVANNIFRVSLTGRHFLRPDKEVNPYLSAKLGWNWFSTNLTIEDPADEFSCHPLESEILARDNTYSFSGGAGIQLDFNSIFPNTGADRIYLDLGVHVAYGGIVRYMNAEKEPGPVPDQDIMAKFINTQSQVVHEHHVGYLYSSTLEMIEYRIGVVWRPAP